MKLKINFIPFVIAALALTLVQCGKGKTEDAHDHSAMAEETPAEAAATGAPQFEVDAAFQGQLNEVFNNYIAIKDAFVSSDAGLAKEKAGAFLTSLAGVDMKLLTGAAHNDWMTYEAGLKSAAVAIQGEGDLEVQRSTFSELSDVMYKSIRAFGLAGTTAYYDFCPMAFDDQGGFWLSDQKEIRNPYFGDKMLSCGRVQETLQ